MRDVTSKSLGTFGDVNLERDYSKCRIAQKSKRHVFYVSEVLPPRDFFCRYIPITREIFLYKYVIE